MKSFLAYISLVLCLFIIPQNYSTAGPVTIASWGGAYTESQKKGPANYASKKTGIKHKFVDYTGGLSELKAQKKSGKIKWDIMDVYARDTIVGCDEGLFVEFDFDKDFAPAPDGTPASQDFLTGMPSKCAVGNILYSWTWAYNTKNVSGTPKTIKDFFNTKKFPGKRALYKGALSNLEIALAADGVKPGNGGANIYKILRTKKGLQRALYKINDLCADPLGGCVFWNAGAQPAELLVNGEVVMSTAWNGRLFNAQIAGKPIKQVWDAQVIDYEFFAMVKNGPNDKNGKALKILREMTSAGGMASQAKYIAYAPWRRSSIPIIEAGEPWYKDGRTNMVPQMSTAPQNTKNFIFMDASFWAENYNKTGNEWEAMKKSIGTGKYLVKKRKKEPVKIAKKAKKTVIDLLKKKKKKKVEIIEQEEFEPGYLKFKDVTVPELIIANNFTVKDSTYTISGKIFDEGSEKIYLEIDGQIVKLEDKEFDIKRFSPVSEKIKLTAIDQWGNRSKTKIINITVDIKETSVVKKLEALDPSKLKMKVNNNTVALIIGIEDYNQSPKAIFANLDAKYFYEYAKKGFGVKQENIKLLIDKDANLISSIGIIEKWLPSKIKKNETNLIVFFAGHGLASNDGKDLFLLSQDSDPDLLARTALSRSEIFNTIIKLKPKTVTMFFDTCYSGVSREEETLLASARPVRIIADEQSTPDNFTIFSASQLDQISSGLKEAKHGIFSYYLMKGLEGKADTNKDNDITNGELLAYMVENVSQKAAEQGRQQIPSLAGDPDKIVMSFR
jgi:putative spermidine/putrescine transport system substrate-binding protein